MRKNSFSVLMSVYDKENPKFLDDALKSILNQTIPANEFILVEDGVLHKELENIVLKYEKKIKGFKVIRLKENGGLGPALNIGIENCTGDYILRADSDDICMPNRFEVQMKYAKEHPDVDVFSAYIYEFKESIEEDMRLKTVPNAQNIDKYIIKRNPINHMCSCFKRKSVIKAGNYQPMLYLEDYYLWIRMYKMGMKLDNMQEPMVYARIGNGFEERRGNKKQLVGWKKLQNYLYSNNLIKKGRYYKNMLNMYLMVYCPTTVRKVAYKLILRKNNR